jgi:hypothetical protein
MKSNCHWEASLVGKKQQILKFDGRAKLGDIAKIENFKHLIELTMNKFEFQNFNRIIKITFSKINKMNKNNIIDYELEKKLNKKKLKRCVKSEGAHSKIF